MRYNPRNLELGQRTRTSTSTHLRCHGPPRKECSQATACARPPPRPIVAGRLSRKRNHPAARSFARAAREKCGGTLTTFLRTAARPSNPLAEPKSLILDLIKCIAYALLPTNRHGLIPVSQPLRSLLLVSKTNVHLLGVGTGRPCRQLRSKADSAPSTVPLRTQHGPTAAQSSNLS